MKRDTDPDILALALMCKAMEATSLRMRLAQVAFVIDKYITHGQSDDEVTPLDTALVDALCGTESPNVQRDAATARAERAEGLLREARAYVFNDVRLDGGGWHPARPVSEVILARIDAALDGGGK